MNGSTIMSEKSNRPGASVVADSRQRLVREAANSAVRRVAPLWPLRHFVAVNPFLGLTDHPFEQAAARLQQSAGARLTMPRSFYQNALLEGRIIDRDLAAALEEAPVGADLPSDVTLFKVALNDPEPHPGKPWPTVADMAASLTEMNWPIVVTDRISAWCADYFDAGQAPLRSPWQNESLYSAWRAEAQLDRTPEILGVPGFRSLAAALPEDPQDALETLVARLHVPSEHLERYFHRLLMTVSGWAGYARYLSWNQELRGGSHSAPVELLVVRLAWEAALLEGVAHGAWLDALKNYAPSQPSMKELQINLVLASAYEKAWQRRFLDLFHEKKPATPTPRPAVQAAFCIDVRSEVIRRSLESLAPSIETIGFAGFFGFPIEYIPFGESSGGARCPVLLAPGIRIAETLQGADAQKTSQVAGQQKIWRKTMKSWKAFKSAAVSCFGFVGPVGWLFAFKMITDSLGWTRPVQRPSGAGLGDKERRRLSPQTFRKPSSDARLGLSSEQALSMAEQVLKGLSLRERFARLVLLAGHGSTTVNKAHATGLDCGACGGHSGEANARVAADVLNDPVVRQGLAIRGFDVPQDTVFVAGLHDTTTDTFTLYDQENIPESHSGDLKQLQAWLDQAGALTRQERAHGLPGLSDASVDEAIFNRSRDWSQVRPEWGLAGCAAFIAAPRERTRGLNLSGRSFLHNYDWRLDDQFAVLELIMTAPMVVASWINLQYYGSTVDNHAFGCGNKVLHNIAGTLGVFEGNGGDLRSGLAIQSLHDGSKWIHEPMRLSVVIEAPIEAMTAILQKHPQVQELVDHRWIHLFSMDAQGRIAYRYGGKLSWQPINGNGKTA